MAKAVAEVAVVAVKPACLWIPELGTAAVAAAVAVPEATVGPEVRQVEAHSESSSLTPRE